MDRRASERIWRLREVLSLSLPKTPCDHDGLRVGVNFAPNRRPFGKV